jgi:predicted enzyme related to lactoylglutathione lyase
VQAQAGEFADDSLTGQSNGHASAGHACALTEQRARCLLLIFGLKTGGTLMLTVHAYVEVTDLERGINFCCEALGLTLRRRLRPNWVELGGANVPIFLLGNRPPVADLGGKKVRRTYEQHWTPVHVDFIVADLDQAIARALKSGASLDREPQHREYGRIANMADPFGNGYDLIEFAPGGYASG